MISFQYQAIDRDGRTASGAVQAPTRRAAIAQLTEQSLFVTLITETNAGPTAPGNQRPAAATPAKAASAKRGVFTIGRRVSRRELAWLWEQLATALQAGLPLLGSLKVVREQTQKPATAELIDDLSSRVEGGESLSDAMRAHQEVFGPLAVSMVEAGETAGVLDEVMGSLAEFAERDLEVVEQVRSAATYPAIVLGLACVSVVVIVTFIMPRIMDNIGGSTAAMPVPTRVLMAISFAVKSYGWLIAIALVLAIWGWRRWVKTPGGRLTFDRLKLKVPVLGPTLRQVAVARFARALGVLSRSGIQIVEALRVLRGTLGNEAMGVTIDHVRERVTHGDPIAQPMRESGQFPEMFVQVVSLGERTGRLDELLLKAARSFDKQTSAAIKRTMTVLPALFIVVLALVVGFILAAVLLPIINMQTAIPGS